MKRILWHFAVVAILAPSLSLALVVLIAVAGSKPEATFVQCISAGMVTGVLGTILTFPVTLLICLISGAQFGGIVSTGAKLRMWHTYATIAPLLLGYGFFARGVARDLGFPVEGIHIIALVVSVPVAKLSQLVWNKRIPAPPPQQ